MDWTDPRLVAVPEKLKCDINIYLIATKGWIYLKDKFITWSTNAKQSNRRDRSPYLRRILPWLPPSFLPWQRRQRVRHHRQQEQQQRGLKEHQYHSQNSTLDAHTGTNIAQEAGDIDVFQSLGEDWGPDGLNFNVGGVDEGSQVIGGGLDLLVGKDQSSCFVRQKIHEKNSAAPYTQADSAMDIFDVTWAVTRGLDK